MVHNCCNILMIIITSYEEMDLESILTILHSVCDTTGNKNLVSVSRQAVFEGAKMAFRRSSFNVMREVDVHFAGEYGIDKGGPTREFMRLLVAEISSLPIFIGPEDQKFLEYVWTGMYIHTYIHTYLLLYYYYLFCKISKRC